MTKSFHDELIDLLEKQGPLSAPQLEAILGWTKNRTHQVLTRARMKYPKQCIRISGYIPHPNKGPAVCLYVAQASRARLAPIDGAVHPTRHLHARSGQIASVGLGLQRCTDQC